MAHVPMDGFSEWQSDPRITQVNREPHRADFYHFNTPETARAGQAFEGDTYLLLHGAWKFRRFDNYQKRPDAFAHPDFNARGWETVQVPACWEEKCDDAAFPDTERYPWEEREDPLPPYAPTKFNPVGCYIRRFHLSAAWFEARAVLCLEGIRSAGYIYINGERIGFTEGSFQRAEFDVTNFVRPGVNVLAVEVYQWSTGSWLENSGGGQGGGLSQDVYLYRTPACYIEDFSVSAVPDAELRDGLLNIQVRTAFPKEGMWIDMTGFDESGGMVAYDSHFLPATGVVELRATIAGVRLWSAETPALYRIVLTLAGDDGVLEATAANVGFRRIEIRHSALYWNGKRLVLKGAVRSEGGFPVDRIATRKEMEQEVRRLKRDRFNAVWSPHGPEKSVWYDLCDRYGLLVVDQNGLDTAATADGGTPGCPVLPGSREEWKSACLDRIGALYERDKNHPCVLMWSLGRMPQGGDNLEQMGRFLKQRDAVRPVCCISGSNPLPSLCTEVSFCFRPSPEHLEDSLQQRTDRPLLLYGAFAPEEAPKNEMRYGALWEKYPCFQGGFFWKENSTAARAGTGALPTPTRGGWPRQNLSFHAVDAATGKVEVTNRFLFTDLSRFLIRWAQTRCGKTLRRGEVRLAAAPGATVLLDLELNRICADEWTLDLSAVCEEDTLWRTAGEPLAQAQFVVQAYLPHRVFSLGKKTPRLLITYGAAVAETDSFSVRVSRRTGFLDSFQIRGNQLLCAPIRPALEGAVEARVQGKVDAMEKREGAILIRTSLSIPTIPSAAAELNYAVTDSGLFVDYRLRLPSGLPSIPEAGLRLCLPGCLMRLSYYGYGPMAQKPGDQTPLSLGVYEKKRARTPADGSLLLEPGRYTDLRWAVFDAPHLALRIEGYPAFSWRVREKKEPHEDQISICTVAEREESEDTLAYALHFALFPQDTESGARD